MYAAGRADGLADKWSDREASEQLQGSDCHSWVMTAPFAETEMVPGLTCGSVLVVVTISSLWLSHSMSRRS